MIPKRTRRPTVESEVGTITIKNARITSTEVEKPALVVGLTTALEGVIFLSYGPQHVPEHRDLFEAELENQGREGLHENVYKERENESDL